MKMKAKLARLKRRVQDWEKNLDDKNKGKDGIAFHKPGSMKR